LYRLSTYISRISEIHKIQESLLTVMRDDKTDHLLHDRVSIPM
jgi:hypothetical protein